MAPSLEDTFGLGRCIMVALRPIRECHRKVAGGAGAERETCRPCRARAESAAVRAACRLPVTRARPGHGNNESERHRELERKLMPMLRA